MQIDDKHVRRGWPRLAVGAAVALVASCGEPAFSSPDTETDAGTDAGVDTEGDTGPPIADDTTGPGNPPDLDDGSTSTPMSTSTSDDTTTDGEMTGGCMPGVFGSSQFGDACFQ